MDYKRYLKQLIDGDSTERKSKSNTEILKEIEAWQRQVGHTDSAEPDVGDEYNDEPLSISPTLELHRHLFVPVAQAKKNNELVQGSQVLKKILGNPHFETLLPSLKNILISSKVDEVVTEEILDLLGYDEMDLVFELVKDRHAVVQAVQDMEDIPQVTTSSTSRAADRQQRSEDRDDGRVTFTAAEAKKRLQDSLIAAANRPLYSSEAQTATAPSYPHIYTTSSHGNVLSSFGGKFILPIGTKREETKEYEEVTIPPANPVPPRISEKPISIPELDDFASGCFPGYTHLNRIQSIVYPVAYGSNENLLICAPTGAVLLLVTICGP
ncbi:hypothetical protein FRC03_001119 [Tulasnella sp. 419]|nr:hypothetical protein FRC03_001119 [Tulasnella sp. 419]